MTQPQRPNILFFGVSEWLTFWLNNYNFLQESSPFATYMDVDQAPSQPGHKLLTSQLQGDTTEMRKDETDSVGKNAKKSRKIVQSGGAINTTTVPEESQEFGAPNGANKGNTRSPQTGHC